MKSNVSAKSAQPNWLREQTRKDEAQRNNMSTAVDLVEAGFAILFVKSTDKNPLTLAHTQLDSEITAPEREEKRRQFFDKHGFDPFQIGATKDRALVRRLLSQNPGLLPAISCGPSGIVVVDNDVKTRDDGVTYNGVALFDAFVLERDARIPPEAVIVQTQGKGRHIYFANPDGAHGSSSGVLKHSCETDIKGVGGYVIAPGAIRIHDGKRYGSRADTAALIKAFKTGTLPQLPQFICDAIGTRPASQASDTNAERALADDLRQAAADDELPIGADLIDPAKGGLDLEALIKNFPDWQEAVEKSNRSACRYNLLVAAKTKRPSLSNYELAAILLAYEESGVFVDDDIPRQGEFNWRNVARDVLRSMGRGESLPEDKSEGEAFSAISDEDEAASDEADAAELKAGKRATLMGDIEAIKDVIHSLNNVDVVLGMPGAERKLATQKRLLKAAEKELEAHDKAEVERAKASSGFLFAKDFDDYKVPDDRIENMIPAVGVTIIVGDSNVGKTFALLEMVRALESGEKYLGHNVESCGAILVTGEGLGGIGRRLAAMRKRWPGVNIAVHTVLPDFGSDANAALRKIKVYTDRYEAVYGRSVKFVALDNLLLMSGALDANKSENASSILKPLQGFAHKNEIAVVLAAHENRQGKEPGSYAWRALTDNMMFLKRKGDVRFLTGDKERDGPANGEARFKLKVVGLGENKWRNPVSSCVVEPVIGPDMPAVTDDEDAPTITRPDRLEHRLQDVLDVFEREGERQKATDEGTRDASRRIELPVSDIQAAVNARRTAEGLVALGRSTVNGHVKAAVERGDLAAGGTAARPLYKLA